MASQGATTAVSRDAAALPTQRSTSRRKPAGAARTASTARVRRARRSRHALADEACCLANAEGGALVVGVAGNGVGAAALVGAELDVEWLCEKVWSYPEPHLGVEVSRSSRTAAGGWSCSSSGATACTARPRGTNTASARSEDAEEFVVRQLRVQPSIKPRDVADILNVREVQGSRILRELREAEVLAIGSKQTRGRGTFHIAGPRFGGAVQRHGLTRWRQRRQYDNASGAGGTPALAASAKPRRGRAPICPELAQVPSSDPSRRKTPFGK